MSINEIGELIRTQDNRITDQPMFIVQQEELDYGYSSEYAEDYHWSNSDEQRVAGEELAELLDSAESIGEELSGWEKVYYKRRWEFVTACFTQKGCEDYLARNGRNLGKTRIYGYGSVRNNEYQAVRKYLMSMEPPTDEQNT